MADCFMAQCKMRENTRRSITLNSGAEIVGCSGDVRYSETVESAPNTNDSTVDLEIVPSPIPSEITRQILKNHYGNKTAIAPEGLDQAAAEIAGARHDVRFHTASVEALHSSLSEEYRPMPILVGFYRKGNKTAEEITLRNETGLPVWLTETASNCTIETNGPVKDNGSGNSITRIPRSI
jgi:hypothetical protein